MTTSQSADHVLGRRAARWLSAIVLCTSLGCQKEGATPAPQTPEDALGDKETPQHGEPTSQNPSTNSQVASNDDTVEVTLCDGKTKTTIVEGTPGTAIAGNLMSEWIRKNPNRNWEADERERHKLQPAADNKDLVGMDQGQTYGEVTEQTAALWKEEAERVAVAGSGVFHSADELGSTIGVSCDMCHPHGANTHPETYPKFQVQLGRVALLRDMINWCIQHPVRGQPLASEDPKMRALEAYILAQRKGKQLNYGKH